MTMGPTAPPEPQFCPQGAAPPMPPTDLGSYPSPYHPVAGIPVVIASPAVNNPPPQQQQPQQQFEKMPQTAQFSHWSTGLCDCFSDMNSCCLVFWCPCVAFGRIAEVVEQGNSSCCACGSLYMVLLLLGAGSAIATSVVGGASGALSFQWILSCVYRGKLKQRLNMPASCCGDCCTHFWCEPCALCQEYRELQHRGYDLSLGWEGNKMKNQSVVSVVSAPVAPSMNR